MGVPNLSKALGRARSLSLWQLADVTGRRGRAYLRSRLEEREALRLGLHRDDPELLPKVVPGSAAMAQAVAALERTAGRLPPPHPSLAAVSPQLLAQADQACAGLWDVLAHRQVALGRTPDWQGDFAAGVHWDEALPARDQPIVRDDGSDIKIPWEISRLQHLPLVAQAFVLTGEARYRDLIGVQLRDWISHNPAGFGVNWTCAMEVALRAVSMSWAFELVRRDAAIGCDLKGRVLWSLFAHGHYLFGHLEDDAVAPGNHYVADLLGLIWLGTLYPSFRGATDWRERGLELLLAHLPKQIRLDGGDEESSIAYHRLVFEMLSLALGVLQANRQRAPALHDAVERMDRFLEALRKPDGSLPLLGDDDSGHAFRTVDVPLRAQRVDCSEFPQSGLACYRDRDLYVLFAATPVGQRGQGGHGHNDKLAIELSHWGDLVCDAGSFAYTGDPAARDAFRATAAHATLQLDDREQNPLPPGDVFHLPEQSHARLLQVQVDGRRFICEGEHRGFAPFVHKRHVTVEGTQITLVDSVLGESAARHELAVRFPLAPGLDAEIAGESVVVTRGGVLALTLATRGATWTLEPGWCSAVYGARTPRHIAVARVSTSLPASVTFTLVVPASPSTPAPTIQS